jgi:hypothetical protein
MHPPLPNVDAAYRNYAELLLRRHGRFLDGRDEDPEMEQIEEDLSALWEKLDEAQRSSLNGMGSDLNWVRRQGTPPPRARPPEAVTEEDRRLLGDAESRKDWHAVLHYLRACAPVLAVGDLARRRVAAYSGVGLPEYADAFRGLAGRTVDKHVFARDMVGGVGSVKALAYTSDRDPASADENRWSPDISAKEEAALFFAAHEHDVSDGQGRLYGAIQMSEGEVRELGVWYQQVAIFWQEVPSLPWGGHPVWQFHQEALVGRPPQKALPPKETLGKMEKAGMITPRQRKRLARGSHA